jgi:hypothetical protein
VKHFLRQRKRDARSFISISPLAAKVAELAEELAFAGREDQAAVAELIAAAGDDKKALEKAFQISRIGGYQHDDQFANRKWRLLNAARTNGPVPPATDEDRARIEAIHKFRHLSKADRWAYLVAREPKIAKLEDEVKRGRYGDLVEDYSSGETTSREIVTADGTRIRQETMRMTVSSDDPAQQVSPKVLERERKSTDLHIKVSRLVGPDSDHEDAVMGSSAAFGTALSHLTDRAPA